MSKHLFTKSNRSRIVNINKIDKCMENKYSEEDLAIYATFYKVSSGNKSFSEWLNEFRFNLWKDSLTKDTVTDIAVPDWFMTIMLNPAVVNTMPGDGTRHIANTHKDRFKVKESIAIKNDYSTIPNDMSYLISVGLFVQAFMNNKAEWSYKLYKLPEQCDIDFAKSGECMLPDEYLSPMRIISPEISTESYNEAMYQGIKFAKEYIKKVN